MPEGKEHYLIINFIFFKYIFNVTRMKGMEYVPILESNDRSILKEVLMRKAGSRIENQRRRKLEQKGWAALWKEIFRGFLSYLKRYEERMEIL